MVVGGAVVGGGVILRGSAMKHTDKGGKWGVERIRWGDLECWQCDNTGLVTLVPLVGKLTCPRSLVLPFNSLRVGSPTYPRQKNGDPKDKAGICQILLFSLASQLQHLLTYLLPSPLSCL